jgi:solute carrier family 25 (mitochondrial 2-oxodicarboxylate transporter), member 21
MSDSSKLFVAGALSGIAEALSVQPFDMIKTRHQLNTSNNPSIITTLRELLNEGGVPRLYRGMLAELVGMVPKTSAMYSTYELSRRYLSEDLGHGETTMVCAASGFIASFPEAIIVTPSQVVKVRLQAKEHLGRFRGPLHCLTETFSLEGPRALFTGLGPTLWRNCIWNSVYFGTMHIVKKNMKVLTGSDSSENSYLRDSLMTFASGFFGATFATCFNAPFDVVKSRFQSQLHLPGVQARYRYTLQTLYLIYKEEGLASCYKGFRPKVIRMGLGGAVAMTTFEAMQKLFGIEKR